jgi:hypothetical protein
MVLENFRWQGKEARAGTDIPSSGADFAIPPAFRDPRSHSLNRFSANAGGLRSNMLILRNPILPRFVLPDAGDRG